MTSVEEGIAVLSTTRGLAMVQSPDRGAGLAAALRIANQLVPEEYRAGDVAVMTPEGARWTLGDLAMQLRFQQGYLPAGEQRVIVLDQADKMDDRAAESLLLTVEEPVVPVIFLAVVREAQAMLPTLRSRSLVVIDAPPRPAGGLSGKLGVALNPPTEAALALCPLTEAALDSGTAPDAVPALQELFPAPTGNAAFIMFDIPNRIRAAAKTVSQKGPNDPATRAVQRELSAAWVDIRHKEALGHLRAAPTPSAVTRCERLEEAQAMLQLHLPLEHVIGYATKDPA